MKEWLYKCDQFFFIDNTPENIKVRLASIHLDGKGLQWHHAFVKSLLTTFLPFWSDYVKIMSDRFREVYDDPMSDLKNLQQTGSVKGITINLM